MNLLQAHELIANRADEGKSLLPEGIEIQAVPGLEPVVPLVTAAAVLSGLLDDAKTDDDLDEAVQHFNSLLSGGVYSFDDWNAEADNVIREVLRWGDSIAFN